MDEEDRDDAEEAVLMAAWPQGDQRREAILEFIREYWEIYKIAPSVAEITEGVGLSSKTAVRHHLEVLGKQGLVTSQTGKYRSIRLTQAA